MTEMRLKDRRILVVDDEERMVRFIRLNLEHDGFRVVTAYNGMQAINKVRSDLPDLVLLDVMMPGELDGLQVLDAIKSDPRTKNTVVAMVTARGQVADGDEARRRGADAYFVKPFSPLQVVSWVREQTK